MPLYVWNGIVLRALVGLIILMVLALICAIISFIIIAAVALSLEQPNDDLSNLELQISLTASDGEPDDLFGFSIALDGNVALIGAPGDGANRGSAYVFVRDENGQWSEQAKLIPSDGESDNDDERGFGDSFGWSVALQGNVAIVGSFDSDGHRGSVYIYERDVSGNWLETTKLMAANEDGVGFGVSLALQDDLLLIGQVFYELMSEIRHGSVFVFERIEDGNWIEQTVLFPQDRATDDFFGMSLDFDGSNAVITRNDMSVHPAVYIFSRNKYGDWIEQQKFEVSKPVVAINQNTAMMCSDVYTEHESGRFWSKMNELPCESVIDIQGNNAVIVGNESVIVYSKDNNGHFQLQKTVTGLKLGDSTYIMNANDFLDGDTVIVSDFYTGTVYVLQSLPALE